MMLHRHDSRQSAGFKQREREQMDMGMDICADGVLTFWFAQNETFDRRIRNRFAGLRARAAQSGLDAWRNTLRGRLAEIIVFRPVFA